MRIVIDMQSVQTESRFRGVGRYSLALAKAMVRNRGEHEIILALSSLFPDTIEPIRAEFDAILPQENIRIWYAPGPVCEGEAGNELRRKVAEYIREAFFVSLKPDILHIMSMFEGYEDDAVTSIGVFDKITPVSAMLYDLIPLLNSEHYLKSNSSYERFYLQKFDYLKQSPLLLSISEFSRQEYLEESKDNPNVVNISTAVEENFKQLDIKQSEIQIISDDFGITKSFVFCTGDVDERKNIPRLISAYALLSDKLRNTHQLVLAGKIPEINVKKLQHKARSVGLRSDELVFTGYITDNDLVKFYNLCELYVFPSWHEGFGLPALEAMSCGAAVIGADTSSLPEVIGNADALFDPFSEKSMAEKITLVLSDENYRQSLILHGMKQANNFNWDQSAKKAIKAYERLLLKNDYNKTIKINEKSLRSDLIQSIACLQGLSGSYQEQALSCCANAISLSLPKKNTPKIFVDISQLVISDFRTGIQRVVRSITKEWLLSPPQDWVVEPVYLSDKDGEWCYYYATSFKKNLLLEQSLKFQNSDNNVVEPSQGDIFLGLDLFNLVCAPIEKGLFNQWRDRGVKIHFVIYDILPVLHPHWWPIEGAEAHSRWLNNIAQVSDSLISISKAVSIETQDRLNDYPVERCRKLKFSWFHLGADVKSSAPTYGMPNNAAGVLEKLQKRETFLMVGTIEPRKGHVQALAAFDKIWAKGLNVNLVIVGSEGWLVDSLIENLRNHSELEKKLFWLEGISDEYLEKIYEASTCLIAASEGEGFGLPLIEAAQHQLPIIVRDIPVFREVAGQYAYFFKDKSAGGLSTTIENWIELYKKKKHPKSNKMPWLTWQQSSVSLLKIILETEEKVFEK